jgi:ribosome-associated protein
MDDLIVGRWVIPSSDLDERFETSGGPGGQHANRNATAVRLRLDVASSSLPQDVKAKLLDRFGPAVEVIAADERSQSRNREIARERMVERIAGALAESKKRRATKPTRASKDRRIARKKARGQTKESRRAPGPDD